MINNVDVSENEDFQKAFNGYYRVGQRPKAFYETYYGFMEKNKYKSPSFEETLRHIHAELGRVEASFSSKLAATINPDLTIWDSMVLKNLGLKPSASHRKNRIEEVISLYNEIVEWYKDYLKKEEAQTIIHLFDSEYPNTGLTDVKKIDFVLWQIRD